MPRVIEIGNLSISMATTKCSHTCRYCLLGKSELQNIPFERFEAVANRFIDWNAHANPAPYRIWLGIDRSFDFDVDTLNGFLDLLEKTGWERENRGIRLGGLPMRTTHEIHRWLSERQERADIRTVHASLAGCDDVHDRWNGRRGDFDFLCRTLSSAAALGLRSAQRIFVTRSTVPLLDELLSRLDGIDGESVRYFSTFAYQGYSRSLEAERIDEAVRDRLWTRFAEPRTRNGAIWYSEREWMRCQDLWAPHVDDVWLRLNITESNIARIERDDCAEIVAELKHSTRAAYGTLPERIELCERYGNDSGMLIYERWEDMERQWLDRYCRDTGANLPRHLTHLA